MHLQSLVRHPRFRQAVWKFLAVVSAVAWVLVFLISQKYILYSPFFYLSILQHVINSLSSVFLKNFRGISLLTPYKLSSLAGSPPVNALLVHDLADFQGVLFGGDSLADVDVVGAFTEPDSDVAGSADSMMKNFADLFGGLDFDAGDADLPAGSVFYDFSIAEGQTLIVCDVADGANIDSVVGDILHNSFSFLVSGGVPFCCLYYIMLWFICQVFFLFLGEIFSPLIFIRSRLCR